MEYAVGPSVCDIRAPTAEGGVIHQQLARGSLLTNLCRESNVQSWLVYLSMSNSKQDAAMQDAASARNLALEILN